MLIVVARWDAWTLFGFFQQCGEEKGITAAVRTDWGHACCTAFSETACKGHKQRGNKVFR